MLTCFPKNVIIMDMNQNYMPEMNFEPQEPMQANGKPLKKKKYLFSVAPKKTRIMSFVALGLAALFAVMVIIGAIRALTMTIWELPFFTLLADEETLDSMEEVYEEAHDAVKEAIREDNEATIEELESRYEMDIDDIEEAVKDPSLLDVSRLAVGLQFAEGLAAMGFMLVLIIGGAAIILLFAILATLLLNKTLLIIGYVLGIPFFTLFAGGGIWAISTLLLIAFIVMQTIVKKAYKNYKKSFAN